MLKIDLNEGRYEIVQIITNSCSAFGTVNTVRLFLGSSPVAVVEMSTIEHTEDLALKLGGRLVGTTAFINLVQSRPETRREKTFGTVQRTASA